MNRNKKFAFNVQLAILGFLKEKDFYGYELKKFMERFMGPWSDIKFGSIYYALEKLTKDGLVVPLTDSQDTNLPERMVYRITPKGVSLFDSMLQESFMALQQIHFLLDVSLFFARGLPKEQILKLLQARADKVGEMCNVWAFLEQNHNGNEIAQLLIDHGLMHLRTEHEYLLKLIDRFTNGNPYGGKSLREWLEGAPLHPEGALPQAEID